MRKQELEDIIQDWKTEAKEWVKAALIDEDEWREDIPSDLLGAFNFLSKIAG